MLAKKFLYCILLFACCANYSMGMYFGDQATELKEKEPDIASFSYTPSKEALRLLHAARAASDWRFKKHDDKRITRLQQALKAAQEAIGDPLGKKLVQRVELIEALLEVFKGNRQLLRDLLQYASTAGSIPALEFFINHGISVNAFAGSFQIKDTLLYWAAFAGQTEAARWLLGRGAHSTIANANEDSPIHAAANWGHAATIELLLSAPYTEIHRPGFCDLTPLDNAVMDAHLEAILVLLNHGARSTAGTRRLASQLYSEKDKKAVTELLDSHSLDRKALEEQFRLAASLGDMHKIEQLLNEDIDIDAVDPEGYSALMLASRSGKRIVVELLLDHHASTRLTNHQGEDACSIARRIAQNPAIPYRIEYEAIGDLLYLHKSISIFS
jgi:ankyrin repeat protein